jgi:tetratricopeptide (TPR) repeat protein
VESFFSEVVIQKRNAIRWRKGTAVVICSVMFALGATLAMAQAQPGETLPMYGQPGIVRPDELKKADAAFARQATIKYGSPGAASSVWAAQGWASLRNGKPEIALQQFNQAWLLNSQNYQVFWGFGAVLSEQGKLEAAVEQLSVANQLIDEPAHKVALLSDLGSVYSELAARLPEDRQLDRAQHFISANQRFAESLDIAPNYAPSWREWAISLYRQERYSEAWIKAKRAIELKAEPFPAGFLDDLRKKHPEPK